MKRIEAVCSACQAVIPITVDPPTDTQFTCQHCGSGNLKLPQVVRFYCSLCDMTRESDHFIPCKCYNSRRAQVLPPMLPFLPPSEQTLPQHPSEDEAKGHQPETAHKAIKEAKAAPAPPLEVKPEEPALAAPRRQSKEVKPKKRRKIKA